MPARPTGCWADSLGDCNGPISAEHVLSVSVWESAGPQDNRAGRINRSVTVTSGPSHALASGVYLVNDLTDLILCTHHNNSSSPVDQEAGNLRRALLSYDDTVKERQSNPGITRIGWYPRTYTVNGPLIERWFMKTAINGGLGFGLPLGGVTAPPGKPTRELCEMVWGRRPVQAPLGLFAVTGVGDTFNFSERFEFIYWDVNSEYIGGCLFRFRGLRFAMNFGPKPIPKDFTNGLHDWHGLEPMRLTRIQSRPKLAVALDFSWPG
jgi:hypothetical protein